MLYGSVSLPTWAIEARSLKNEMVFGSSKVSWSSQEALNEG
jgi:hypothetical protein